MDQSLAPLTLRTRHQPRIRGLAIGLGLVLAAMSTGTVQAGHADGVLSCGEAGTYAVDGRGVPDSPVPWSGLFHLEGTNTVFRALSIEGQAFPFSRPKVEKFPGNVVQCTLSSDGIGFPAGYWTLTGVLTP